MEEALHDNQIFLVGIRRAAQQRKRKVRKALFVVLFEIDGVCQLPHQRLAYCSKYLCR